MVSGWFERLSSIVAQGNWVNYPARGRLAQRDKLAPAFSTCRCAFVVEVIGFFAYSMKRSCQDARGFRMRNTRLRFLTLPILAALTAPACCTEPIHSTNGVTTSVLQ